MRYLTCVGMLTLVWTLVAGGGPIHAQDKTATPDDAAENKVEPPPPIGPPAQRSAMATMRYRFMSFLRPVAERECGSATL